ncbi:MAG: hypothetical protein LBQ66_15275 [Planctomycetaceae bacterium]|nr:hypothetical protein [Planctomycetaceae bacterium]
MSYRTVPTKPHDYHQFKYHVKERMLYKEEDASHNNPTSTTEISIANSL